MSDLQAIVRSKVDADLNRRLIDLPAEVKALQRQHAAKGSLMSGNMLSGVLKLTQQALQAQGNAVTTHYTWAVNEALAASQSWVMALATDGADSLAPLATNSSELLTEACRIANQPGLSPRLIGDLETTHLQVREGIKTSLAAVYATKSRGLLRKLGSLLGKAVKTGGSSP
jgi:hypothetical protein